jgi:membrane-bound metal-dependent hydrolase YbcI (DUF457 family)
MDLFTHAVVGAFVYLQFVKGLPLNFLYWAIFCAILPDLDIFLIPLKKRLDSKYLEHRGGSHSYVVGIMVSAIFAVIFIAITKQNYILSWIIGMLFYGLHVTMDTLTTTKIPILFPLSKIEVSFYIEKAGSFFTMMVSIIYIIIYSPFYFTSADYEILMMIINSFSLFFLLYYIYRIISNIWVKPRLNRDQVYLPAVLPTKYSIFSFLKDNNHVDICLITKTHFTKEEIIYTNHVTMTEKETEIYEKSIKLCKSVYYYSKWTLLPILSNRGDVITVRIYFLETLIHNKTSYMLYTYDSESMELLEFDRGYGLIQSQ